MLHWHEPEADALSVCEGRPMRSDQGMNEGPNVWLNASKMIMRPERVTEERLDPSQGQRDCRYGEGSPSGPGRVPGNAAPHPRAAARTCCDDDYESRPVARRARAIQCGWRPDHRQAYTPGADALAVRGACCARAGNQPMCGS